jgi:hypothetical protein
LQCAAALQQWPKVLRLISGLVTNNGAPLLSADPQGEYEDYQFDGEHDEIYALMQQPTYLHQLQALVGHCNELDDSRRLMLQRVCVQGSLVLAEASARGGACTIGELKGRRSDASKALNEVLRRLQREMAGAPRARSDSSRTLGTGSVNTGILTSRCLVLTAHSHALVGELSRAVAATARAVTSIPAIYASLHPLAISARLRALLPLQPLAELREYESFASSIAARHLRLNSVTEFNGGSDFAIQLRALFGQWRERSASGQALSSIDCLQLSSELIAGREVFAAGILKAGSTQRLDAQAMGGRAAADIIHVRE